MGLSSEQVLHISRLARLGLTDAEVELFRDQLSSIIEHVNKLSELDTEAIPPTAQVIELLDVFAKDEPSTSYSTDEMLANAPEKEENCFKVITVLGYET
ncbi:glutamyl-tRNA(Gln) amidotransferase, C subunit [Thermobaculum terrenum ATCC BAA-798]|uniref:Aspartyl/glutamyl-tRNA(Asn/Gln) amidotransferase subunit C n=1 Tax=Thermobaculum terrenum (strain ATCC BAA-798 / CCMEE 7001 / YNP1) TaxID=525904 RepID=D1CDH6_THET1|nr:Asp-tRNA(Asn)/Glu-tRNA(Gln) amidotransferase subunit GatC [Thermobaculum terrenum]ACZ40982.1 glutamyl-tRNA(Gln) amidotransferase, C subunit [Thermobaculum terrenum ATCC BAA-798]